VTNISVIICTRNPLRAYLQRVLDSLRQQTLGKEHWELMIVDNASDKRLQEEWDVSWHPRARHVREETLGVMSARLRGLSEGRGPLFVFVDDDTIPDVDFLSRALALSVSHPELGAFGAGTIEPEFEVFPSADLVPRLEMLGLRTIKSSIWSNNPNDFSCCPWGAGLCVRQEVAKAYERLAHHLHVNQVVGRCGSRLFAGEDDLFSWAASSVGCGFGLFPELRLTHLIPRKRIQHDYFIRLVHDHSFSHSVLRHLLTGKKLQRFGVGKYLELLAHGLKNGKFSMQCAYAVSHGEHEASRFIKERQLHPLVEMLQVTSMPLILALLAIA
jgi:glycosyltransferase involved in cell wall biosynthesis